MNRAFETLGRQARSDRAIEAARGVVRIANANMTNALRLVSTNKGYDPRDFALMAFGGGGPMHAVALARELKVPRVIVPVNSAVFSAWGMLLTDLRRDYVNTYLMALDAAHGGRRRGAIPLYGGRGDGQHGARWFQAEDEARWNSSTCWICATRVRSIR